MIVIVISIVFQTISSLIINPINQSCLIGIGFETQFLPELNLSLPVFELPPFSQSLIEVDLRHLISNINTTAQIYQLSAIIFQQSTSNVAQYSTFNNLQQQCSNKYVFYVDQNSRIALYFTLKTGYEAYKYLLLGSVSIKVIIQNQRILQQQSSFLFIISSLNNINLPINRPKVTEYSGYYLDKIHQNFTSLNSLSSSPTADISPEAISKIYTQSANSYWTIFNTLAIPYLPYISNCKGQSNKMYLSQLMQSIDDCNLISVADTLPIDEFKFGSAPTADTCNIKRQCIIDEVPGVSSQFPYWVNLPQGSTLFSITQDKVSYKDYQINLNIDQNSLVNCNLNTSRGTNASYQYPLNVKITINYYQITKETKKMISCSVDYSLYLDSNANFTYVFQLEIKPLNHTYIMLAFGFEWYVYMIIFVIIGVISNLQNLVLWMFHFFVSSKKKKQVRLRVYLKVILQILKGTCIALLFSGIILFSISLIMNAKFFSTTLYSSSTANTIPLIFWDYLNNIYISDYQSDLAIRYRSGRMGLAFVSVGTIIIFYSSQFFIGCEKKKKQYDEYQIMGRQLKPRLWNKGKFIFGTYIYIFIQFFFIYFAYSATYSQNIWTFIVLMKLIQIVLEQITLSIYQDSLPCLPFKVITDITAYMNTLSANNLYDFLFSFLIDVAITMIEKAYIPELQNIVVQKVHTKMNEFVKFYAHLINDTEGEANQAQLEDKQQIQEENQMVVISYGLTDEVKFFDQDDTQIYNDDQQIQWPKQSDQINVIQKTIVHKLLLYRRYQAKQFNESQNINDIAIHGITRKDVNKKVSNAKNENHEQLANCQKNQEQKMEQSTMVFQILLDNILLLFTFMLQPFVILACWVTYDQSAILSNYGISNRVVILYLLSALVITVFTVFNMVMIFHLLQCYLDVDFQQIINKLLDRFVGRTKFWKAKDQDINNQINLVFRGADHYCLSWQFFFILATYISAMMFIILGLSIMINSTYNPFMDVSMTLVGLFWCLFTILAIFLIQKIAYLLNIDKWRQIQQSSININAVIDFSLNYKKYKINNNQSVKQQIQTKQQKEQQTNQNLIMSCSDNSQNQIISKKSTQYNTKNVEIQRIHGYTLKVQGQKQIQYESEDEEQQQQDNNVEIGSQSAVNIKVSNICKNLQSLFTNPKFNFEYFQKNKAYVRKNIDKILCLMDELPEISQYKMAQTQNQICHEYNTQSSLNGGGKHNGKRENKICDTDIQSIINKWKQSAKNMINYRQKEGKQTQQSLHECTYCFQPWGIYYGATNHSLYSRTLRENSNSDVGMDGQGSMKHVDKPEKNGACFKCMSLLDQPNEYIHTKTA